jgi:exosortase/archaeosortase family protein
MYLFLFSESRTIDKPLTNLVSNQSAYLLNNFKNTNEFIVRPSVSYHEIDGLTHISENNLLIFKNNPVIIVLDSCNGLELFVLYVGFIIAMPSVWYRKLSFSIFGIILIHFMNILRCVGLAELAIHWVSAFHIAHHYVFKIVVYSTIFFLWYWYCKKIDLSKY